MSETKPFLQLRWTANDGSAGYRRSDGWLCHYELVLPLSEHDIRREDKDGNKIHDRLVVPIKPPSWRGGERAPCAEGEFDPPYRDGAHANWDSEALGGLPIVVIALDGTAIPEPTDRLARRTPSLPASAEGVEAILHAALDCPHEIDGEKVVLKASLSKPGNALAQLSTRLSAALKAETSR